METIEPTEFETEVETEFEVETDFHFETAYETAFDAVTSTFEACSEHLGHDRDAPCVRCGWLGRDHVAALAVVIEVRRPEPMPLRRAG